MATFLSEFKWFNVIIRISRGSLAEYTWYLNTMVIKSYNFPMLISFNFMMEAWATRLNRRYNSCLQYRGWGLKISWMNVSSSNVIAISSRTKNTNNNYNSRRKRRNSFYSRTKPTDTYSYAPSHLGYFVLSAVGLIRKTFHPLN